MQPNTTVTALVVLLYLASSVTGIRGNKNGSSAPTPPGVHTTTPTPQRQTNTPKDMAGRSAATREQANVRTGPGTQYPRSTQLAPGTQVRIQSEVNGWYQVQLPTKAYGWIHGSLLNVQSASGSQSGSGRDVVGYYIVNYPGDRSSYNALHAYSNAITTVVPFSYSVDRNGNVSGEHFADARQIAQARGLSNLALVHNIDGGSFSKTEISAMLNSKAARARAISGIRRILETHKYDGVNIDFENVPPADRAALTLFMKELRVELVPRGYRVTMSVPAKHKDNPTAAWVGAFDYYELGKQVDQLMLMTYDEHTSGTAPGPVASLPWVEKVIRYAITQVPRNKILLGLAGYGYDWNTQTNKARSVTYSQAISLAGRHGVKIQWDDRSQTPYFKYTSDGVRREVWFESADSLRVKLKLVQQYNLGGIALWRLGLEDQAYWDLIERELLR
ncbi:MAG: glycosyl hydrolase family 18 protein [Firmicutes bacterium]|jgi:spore germination protein YaaH|nr:glycosyl hydrolase family 18 protein [Bacillota bacterium]